jgi:protein-disulfide isomerase
MSKQFLAVIVAVILLFVGIAVVSNHKTGGSGSGGTGALTNHVEGLGKDNVTLVEYGDYQCPYCGEFYPTIKQIQAEYNQQSLHPNAFAGARAAEAAAMQGKFWQMHDLLYDQNQVYYNSNETANTWISASDPSADFDQYAQSLGLNVTKFKTDYASTAVNDLINNDMNEGNKLGINATPTFILDGKQLNITTNTASVFEKYINAEIAKKAPATTSSTAAH